MTFDDYRRALAPVRRFVRLGDAAGHSDIREAAKRLTGLPEIDRAVLTREIAAHPEWVPALGLVVGLSQEGLKNLLKHKLETAGWVGLARTRPHDLVAALDDECGLVAELAAQRHRSHDFGDVLIARAGSRQRAGSAIAGGRGVEDAIEAVVRGLGLPYEVRTRFVGRDTREAPCDVAIPSGRGALIVCAAKGFDSTGSKLTDAVREIEEMAEVRLPTQYVFAVVDGIGWKSRQADLRRIFDLSARRRIDGLYTLAMLDKFATDLDQASVRVGLR